MKKTIYTVSTAAGGDDESTAEISVALDDIQAVIVQTRYDESSYGPKLPHQICLSSGVAITSVDKSAAEAIHRAWLKFNNNKEEE